MAILKKIPAFFLRVVISIALLSFLFKQVDINTLGRIIKGADKPLLFVAFLVTIFIYILCFLRWEMLLRAAGINVLKSKLIPSFSGGVFFNSLMPSTIGGDLVRGADLSFHTGKPGAVVATVILDRLSGYAGLVSVTLLSLFLGKEMLWDRSIASSIFILTFILVFILFLLFNNYFYSRIKRFLQAPNAGKIRLFLENIHNEMHGLRYHKKILLWSFFVSFVIQGLSPLVFSIIALALGIKMQLIYFFIFLPIIGAIILLPVSIGGLGLRDTATVFFFAKVGLGKDLSFAMSLSYFFIITVIAGIGGIIYVFTLRNRRLQHDKA
jgi:hypothetical protein